MKIKHLGYALSVVIGYLLASLPTPTAVLVAILIAISNGFISSEDANEKLF